MLQWGQPAACISVIRISTLEVAWLRSNHNNEEVGQTIPHFHRETLLLRNMSTEKFVKMVNKHYANFDRVICVYYVRLNIILGTSQYLHWSLPGSPINAEFPKFETLKTEKGGKTVLSHNC